MRIVASEYSEFNGHVLLSAIILFLILVILKRRELKKLFHSKYVKKVSVLGVNIFLTCSIIGMVNYIIVKNDNTFDLTKTSIHSLSTQSKSVLQQLNPKSKLKLTLFAKRNSWSHYLNLLNLYKLASSQVEVHAVDIEENPSLASLNKVKQSGVVLVEYQGKKFQAKAGNELDITNALIKMLRNKSFIIYYTSDHGELDFNSTQSIGLSYLKEQIEASNYSLKKVSLLSPVPKDASALLILNPQTSFLDNEIINLSTYLENAGSLITTFSPRFDDIHLEKYEEFLALRGIKFINGIVLDRLSAQQGSQASIPVVSSYNLKHPITKDFSGRSIYPISAILERIDRSEFEVSSLVSTTSFPASWGEKNFSEVKAGKSTFDIDQDIKGPINLLMASYSERLDSRILVSSSSAFISNQFSGQLNNFNLFLNMVAWAIKDEQLISLDRPGRNQSVVYLSDMQVSLILYFTVLFLPFLFFSIAIFVFRKRRGL